MAVVTHAGGSARAGLIALQVLRHHHAHGVAEADFRQQIVQRRQLHAVQLVLNVFLRDFGQLAAAAQRVVEQTAAEADGVVALEILQHLANFGARFRADHEIQPRRWAARPVR